MRHSIETSIHIQASAADIWQALIQFNDYPKWNPFIHSISGDLSLGGKLAIAIGSMRFKPIVQSLIPVKEFSWRGRLLLPGIFDGTHSFVLHPQTDGTCTFVHSESFRGVLVPLMRRKLNGEIRAGFEKMNEALKALVERS